MDVLGKGASSEVVFCVVIVSLLLIPTEPTQFPVGDLDFREGWFNESVITNWFQSWAYNKSFHVGDSIDFGPYAPDLEEKFGDVLNVTAEQEQEHNCAAIKEAKVPPILPTNTSTGKRIIYEFQREGQFAFVSSKLCDLLRFRVEVELPPPRKRHKRSLVTVSVGVSLAAVFLAGVIVGALCMARRKYMGNKSKPSGGPRISSGMSSYITATTTPSKTPDQVLDIEWPWPSGVPQRFSLKDLKAATKSFTASHVLGEGGFGTVYKGFLGGSPLRPVAVKRLSQFARQGAREFMAEVSIISQLRHRNLVQLLGWCDENEELILVYEYMPNGDLDELIFGSSYGKSQEWTPLPWKHRFHIFVGVATALVYLHEEWDQRVVHRDVKTSNVMLDSHFNARLGDFGLARISAHSQAPRTTLVAGTIGYLAPEFNLTGRATDKTDVYAFGVVVLEVVCARRPLTTNCILVDWVWELHKEDKILDAIDRKLVQDEMSSTDKEEMRLALQLGLLCSHPDPVARPSMRTVLNVLTGDTPSPKLPRCKPVAQFAESENW